MEDGFIFNLKQTSIEVIIIGAIVFSLTMLIKWPIKKFTAKFDENKRKAINTIIVFIPMLLSLVFNVLYSGIFKNVWFDVMTFESMATSYLVAVSIYAIYARIVIIVKGTKTNSTDIEMSKQAVKYIKSNIKILSKTLKVDEKKLSEIISKIENLLALKEEITNKSFLQDISAVENINNEIKELENKKIEITESINISQYQIENYKKSLNNKGEI